MINETNLDKLYDSFIDEDELTTKKLKELGFNSTDLNKLIEKDLIIRTRRGIYSLNKIDGLYFFGKKLIALRKHDRATLCFKKCYNINPTHNGVCFQLFLRAIQQKDYDEALKYYSTFWNANKFYDVDNRLYLYLLSVITNLPVDYREYAKILQLDDLEVDKEDKRYNDINLQNKIRLSVFNQRFTLACKQLNDYIKEKESLSVQDLTIRTLLIQAVEKQMQDKQTIIDLLTQKKYKDIIKLYDEMSFFHRLGMVDNYILYLTTELLNIIETNKIPKVRVVDTNNIFDAIDGQNFSLAFDLAKKYSDKYNVDKNYNVFYLILKDIVKQCERLNSKLDNANKATFSDVIKFLMSGNLDETFKCLKSYLSHLNKSCYEFLIRDLIKISVLTNDKIFTKPVKELALISKESYVFDIYSYVQDFYISLSQKRFEEAKIYLDIIKNGEALVQDRIAINELYQIFEVAKEEKETLKQDIDVPIKKEEKETMAQDIGVPVKKEEVGKRKPKPLIKKDEITLADKDFMNRKHKELLANKGIILLRKMNSSRIEKILKMTEDYSDMDAFVIGNDNKQQVVLRYKTLDEGINKKDLINIANKAYGEKDYAKCIEVNLQLLSLFNKPKEIIYSKLGLAYMKMMNISLAIDYLTIADDLAKKEHSDFNFSYLIARLKNEIPQEDIKPNFKMELEDFVYDDKYDSLFNMINNLVMVYGLNLNEACAQLGLNEEEALIVKLVYAREFYTQGNYVKGDLFFKAVEKEKNKTDAVKALLKEVQTNRRFYQNRKEDRDVKLSLTLVP